MLSTNCRACQCYLKIEKGKAIPPAHFNEKPRYQANTEAGRAIEKPTAPQTATTPQALPTPSKPDAKLQPEKKTEPKASLPKYPPIGEKTSKTEPEDTTPVSPVPVTPPKKEEVAAASIPRTEPRNPLPRKPVKPKAPPPPPKPAPLPASKAENTPTKDAPEPTPTPPSTERYRPPNAPVELSKPTIAPLINREKKRSVKCFECDQEHEILADSTSALCPHCGAYIGLKHYDIRDQVNSRIQTRGNVFVHKKGYITGITIQCHNLTIEGEIQGGAECSGDFIVRKTGKINGPVTSDRVIIERRAQVDFMSTVTAREVIIDGFVTGSVACKKLVLKKRATLDGDLTVASLSIEEGARHTGNIQMTGLL